MGLNDFLESLMGFVIGFVIGFEIDFFIECVIGFRKPRHIHNLNN